MTRRIVVFLLSSLLLVACGAENTKSAVSTITSMPMTVSATSVPIHTLPTSGTPTVLPDAMRYQCLEIANQPPSDHIEKGVTIFNVDGNLDSFLWNNDTKDVYKFPREEGDRLLQFEVSPDKKHIMYQHYFNNSQERRLVITRADGQSIWSQVIYSYYWNWFDNERLIGLVIPQNESPSLFLLNPFSGERQELRVDYPNSEMFSNDVFPRWRYSSGGLPIHDPTLTRVVYPACDEECQDRLIRGEPGWPLVLWDMDNGQGLAEIMTMDGYGETPIWTPDGKEFILATKIDPNDPYPPANEFFAVSRDGEVRQLTRFMDSFQEIYIPDNYSLSPDGKLLAFWIVATPSQYDDARLAVLNTETGEVINYCIKGDPFMDNAASPNSLKDPIWSPDSTQLLVISRNPEDTRIRRVVLVDIVRNYAAQIGADIEPVGWMIAP